MRDITAWLEEIGLARHGETFRTNAIDFDVLSALDENDLKELGLPLGDRKRLLRAIAELGKPSDEAAPREAPPSAASALSPERRQLTVLFVDLVDSTALSQALDPEDLRDVMRGYHEAVATAIRNGGGFVAKFMGDGVLAYFGYPQATEDAAERAVQASLRAIDAVKALPSPKGRSLAAKVGVATGPVVVGDVVGDDIAREVNVVGETPNLAARLLGLGAPNGVVIAESTRRIVGDLFAFTALGPQMVKGISEPVLAFAVTGERHGLSRFEATRNARRSQFVGRGQEVGLLLDRWDQAKAGDGHLVLLSGEAGIGKSRIVETMVQQIGTEPHHRIRYQCTPQHTNSPLYPAIVQLGAGTGILPDDDAAMRAAKVGVAMPDATSDQIELVASLLGASIPEGSPLSSLTPTRRRELTLAAFASQLETLCRQRPVLWVVEDAHWIDPTTEELVSRVVGKAGSERLLVVVTHRPTYGPPWTSAPIATQLALNRLSRTHAGALLDGLGGGKPVPSEAVDYILDRTDGVPLYMEELFQALRDSGTLRETATDFELARALQGTAVPATLQDALMARLDRLAPAKAVAQLGAAIGREFEQGLLTAVAAMRPEALREGLDQLLAAGLIFVRGQPPEATYIFKHALVQDAAYGSLLKAQRQAIHVRVSEALIERQGDAEPEVIARHLERSGNLPQAIDWWERAGDAASQSSASGEAIAHYQSALSLYDEISSDLPACQQQAKLCQKLAATLMQTEGFQSGRARELYEESQRIALDAQDPDTYVRGSIALWTNQYQLGMFEPALAEFEGLSASTLSEVTTPTRAKFLRARGTARYCVGRLVEAQADFAAAVQTADTLQADPQHALLVGDPAITGRAYAARTLIILGWPGQGLQMARDGVQLARTRGHAFDIQWALQALGRADIWLCRFPDGAAMLTEALSICEQHGFGSHRGLALLMRGVSKIGSGDTAQGSAEFDEGFALWKKTTGLIHVTQYLAEAAHVCAVRREFDLAERYLDDADKIVLKTNERSHKAELVRLRGLLCEVHGQRGRAISRLREALAVADAQEANGFKLRAARDLARILAEDNDIEGARSVLAPVYAWFTEGFDTPDLKEAKALLDRLAVR